MANLIYIAVSLDGYIASSDGSLDWLINIPNPDQSDFGFNDFLNRINGILMGRKTFEQVVSFGEWPYSKKVFVLTRTLRAVPEHLKEKAEIINGEIPQVLQNLNRMGYNNLYIDGGQTVQSFLRLDLIDEMIITRIPVLLGDGIPLFGSIPNLLKFKVVSTEKLSDHMVKNHYFRIRDDA